MIKMKGSTAKSPHDSFAPYWALAMILFLLCGLGTINFNFGSFWKGYVLDMTGPAWTYILFRGLFTGKVSNRWTRFFKPVRTYVLLFLVSSGIETAQYFELYDATFDPFDLLAYNALMLPAFILDLVQESKILARKGEEERSGQAA